MTVALAAEPCAACKKTQCPDCGRWSIWKRRVSNQERERP